METLQKISILVCLIGVTSAQQPDPLAVNLEDGSFIRGQYRVSHSGRGIRAFKNIPYAEPPIGQLRFADPVPKANSSNDPSIFDTFLVCPQVDEVTSTPRLYMGQEDCLYMNVYSPLEPTTRALLPVMFFIHGGGYSTGGGNEILYGPDFLLDHDVILVTGNYRLSALGFLTTNNEVFPGNYGMKDQVAMLRWVRQNIHRFGGDPNQVTIFGESAGASSVGNHLMSPMSKGLFQRAILQSGSPFDIWTVRTHEENMGLAVKMFEQMDCGSTTNGDYETILNCMRQKDAREIVEASSTIYYEWDVHPNVIFAPTRELNSKDPFITEKNFQNLTDSSSDIPVLMGLNRDDGSFIPAMIAKKPQLIREFVQRFDQVIGPTLNLFELFDNETFREKVEMIKDFYFDGKDFSWERNIYDLAQLVTDVQFLDGFDEMLQQRLGCNANTFAYLFNYRGTASNTDLILRNTTFDVDLGVSHVDELLYLFPIVKNSINFKAMDKQDQAIRKQMVDMWVAFASTGNPSTGYQEWQPVRQNKYPLDYMRIGNCNPASCEPSEMLKSQMETGLFEENVEFLHEFFESPRRPRRSTRKF